MNPIEQRIERAVPYDKCLHVIAGVLIFAAVHFIDWRAAVAAAALAGIGKEVFDHFTGGDVSLGDIAATCCGGLLGMCCYL
ncbi:hypothetical protein DF107_18215 [Burkholderia stagnalis]|uniref:hypothetical protein n=1 Tax=Burkholderia stagnalis TaxID=1503054 RepID=UPI000F5AD7F4|nr:hypothetical protein [Burkholderia stagnalis]RQQ19737.1 hypothetical protein DF161_07140 [Burkholderia stagnalis]RQY67286.1 hypothetical protein DF109_08030 [Burkholderia stagnalis]RQY80051.1 hypothetical protein DF107_18215 [Burkholderia stagnalis]